MITTVSNPQRRSLDQSDSLRKYWRNLISRASNSRCATLRAPCFGFLQQPRTAQPAPHSAHRRWRTTALAQHRQTLRPHSNTATTNRRRRCIDKSLARRLPSLIGRRLSFAAARPFASLFPKPDLAVAFHFLCSRSLPLFVRLKCRRSFAPNRLPPTFISHSAYTPAPPSHHLALPISRPLLLWARASGLRPRFTKCSI